MNSQLLYLLLIAAGIASVIGVAVLLVVFALVGASLLPRGHPLADRLRNFASRIPVAGFRIIMALDGLLFVAIVLLFGFLTIKFS